MESERELMDEIEAAPRLYAQFCETHNQMCLYRETLTWVREQCAVLQIQNEKLRRELAQAEEAQV